jgi:hypothetical protein
VADVGDEFLAGVFELLEAGEIMEDQDGPLSLAFGIEDRGGIDLETVPSLARRLTSSGSV